jgi:hypothetical protein
MSKKNTNKNSAVGCLTSLAVAIVAFVYLPWQAALGTLIAIFIILLLITGISREISKIRKRNITQKTLINKASSGFTELVSKVVNDNKGLVTWLGGEPAGYRWLSFNHFHRPKNRTENNAGHWASFFDHESESKALTVTDGSGECSVLLHMADFRIASETKRFKPEELLQKLKENPISGFDFDSIKKKETVLVEELWIPKDQYVYLYGDMYSFEDNPPEELLQKIEKSWRGGDYRNNERKLDSEDWKDLINKSKERGNSRIKILTSNYDQDPADGIIISQSDDTKINLTSYFSIAALSLGILFVIFVGYFLLRAEYPEIAQKIISYFN